MDEKLQFSAQDLGRLAAFMNRENPGHPLHQIMDWLRDHAQNDVELKAISNQVIEGYNDESAS
jgi:hypothetical protein